MKVVVGALACIGFLVVVVVGCGDGGKEPPQRDLGITQPDQSVTHEDQGMTTDSNSGAICTQSAPCKVTSERCMALETGATTGMCFGMCNTAQADCPVADQATQLAKCLLQDENNQLLCAWMCEVQGTTYKCPNDTDYKCMSLKASQPNVKYCAPK
jgi:hypothetical protein